MVSTRKFDRRHFIARIALLLAAPYALASRAFAAKSLEAKSGQPAIAKSTYQIDRSGREWPVSFNYPALPKHGTVRTAISSAQRPTYPKGEIKAVRLAEVVYQSKKGYVGEDSFTYVRITADPTDPYNHHEETVAVTVK